MSSTTRTKRTVNRSESGTPRFETLETRRHLSRAPLAAVGSTTLLNSDVVELRPDLLSANSRGGTLNGTALTPPADIVWVNRGSDGFNAVFGANAEVARAVVDAMITQYERMIGSFNYSDGSANFNLTVSMGNPGIGVETAVGATLNGKPKSATAILKTGNDGLGSGWFIDPTPFDNSEFQGQIINPFVADAQTGSPAVNKSDLLTYVGWAIAHCVGVGLSPSGWAARVTNTGVNDTVTGSGKLWVFRGSSIKHLMTSGFGLSQDAGFAVNSSSPGSSVTFQGDSYLAAADQINPSFALTRRYLISNTSALMLKDAFGYSTVNPATFQGTFYNYLNPTTGVLTVRGGDFAAGQANSDDIITISRSGDTISVSTDAGKDVPGTGALPGAGNLPAWVTEYDASQISSIVVNAGAGNDSITVGGTVGKTVSVTGGAGIDSLTFNDPAAGMRMHAHPTSFTSEQNQAVVTTVTNVSGDVESFAMLGNANVARWYADGTAPNRPLSITGGSSDDAFFLIDATAANYPAAVSISDPGGANDFLEIDDSVLDGTSNYNINQASIQKNNGFAGVSHSGLESVRIFGETGSNLFAVGATVCETRIDGGATQDTYLAINTLANAPLVVTNSTGEDILNVSGILANSYARLERSLAFGEINVGGSSFGGAAQLDVVAAANAVITTKSLAFTTNGTLNLNDNDLILDYTGASQLAAVQAQMNSARAGGTWSGAGITSWAARDNPQHNTTLGAMEASDYESIYGPGATFGGQPIDSTAVLVKYTYYGDTDFNGVINFDDYSRTDAGFNGNRTGWLNGDFDGSGGVDFDDYSLIDLAFNTQGSVLRALA